jgi:hypothetical protein
MHGRAILVEYMCTAMASRLTQKGLLYYHQSDPDPDPDPGEEGEITYMDGCN